MRVTSPTPQEKLFISAFEGECLNVCIGKTLNLQRQYYFNYGTDDVETIGFAFAVIVVSNTLLQRPLFPLNKV